MTIYILSAFVAWLLGAQVAFRELHLLSGKYNYKIKTPQFVTFVSCALTLLLLACDVCNSSFGWPWFLGICGMALAYTVWEWVLAMLSPRHLLTSLLLRTVFILVAAWGLSQAGMMILTPFVVAGLFFRNSPFGVVHGKPFFLVSWMRRKGLREQAFDGVNDRHQSACSRDFFDVTAYGIQPDTDEDLTERVQKLIDQVGLQGGGVVFFPRGHYLFNKQGRKTFLQINYSHVTIEGERSEDGELLTELVNGGNLVQGSRNPWISPFFITTGERLQPSNMFFGLDFKNPQYIRSESSSLSDPGSDGKILTPAFATSITADAKTGATLLHVEDSSLVAQYIVIGMYNTDADGSLVKELLGVQQLRPEWHTALRAGKEEAPSFQWLVEVKRVVDAHTIELCRPLLCDISLKYEPQVFNVEMLEDIHIRNLRISSLWNGLFHHHGLPLYYSVAQAQEMDYGWNGINMKRVTHSTVENVEMKNFTNPLYVQDSREVTVEYVKIKGYDGHQGIKVYCHTCDCQFQHIGFYCHFADMMGGEGNAYANVFSDVSYLNPTFNPVDFDFHGFSEGPMGPPAYNVFERIHGFRFIKGAGAVFMQPASGVGNVWREVAFEGGRRGEQPYYALSYRVRSGMEKYVTALGYTLVMMMKRKKHSLSFAKGVFKDKLMDIDYMSIPRDKHGMFFPGCRVLTSKG